MQRQTIGLAVIVLLLTAPAFAADPPGGPGWYQLGDVGLSIPTTSGTLLISGHTPGFLVGTTTAGLLRIRFERGIATWLGREITTDGGFGSTLTVDVDPELLRAFVKQPLSRLTPDTPPRKGGAEPGALGAIAGTTGAGVGGRSNVGVQRETTIVVDDTVNVVRRESAVAGAPDGGRSGVQVFPPAGSAAGSGGTGGATRVISREEHDARLAKVLALWGDDGARCETKGYGPGWISICESAA